MLAKGLHILTIFNDVTSQPIYLCIYVSYLSYLSFQLSPSFFYLSQQHTLHVSNADFHFLVFFNGKLSAQNSSSANFKGLLADFRGWPPGSALAASEALLLLLVSFMALWWWANIRSSINFFWLSIVWKYKKSSMEINLYMLYGYLLSFHNSVT